VIGWALSLIAAATLFVAWWYPGSSVCAVLGWSSIAFFYAALSAPRQRIRRFFVAGILTYIGGFYWLYSTIREFGGFPFPAAISVFLLFVCGSAIQFIIWAFSWENLPRWCSRWGLRTPLSWLVAHHFWIKIFPWDFGHTQLGFVPFAQLAGIFGVTGISFLMMWVVETISNRRNVALFARGLAAASFVGAIGYGYWVQEQISTLPNKPLSTVMIQGNVSLQHKHDMTFFTVNREQYLKTSLKVAEMDSLVIWPESTITEFIPANISDVSTSSLLPFLGNGSAFLVGGLTYRSRAEYFNSSILVRPDGTVAQPYNKMILMPFGEYTPFASTFPWLAEINATAGQFTAGEAPSVLSFNLSNGSEVKLAPLICYEDIVPPLAREATARGAEILVNQTNDAWFGDTIAPYQHHMIAAFRAIENRRYLLRSTNTGLTAVVDPLGRTLASLLPYTESVLSMEVSRINYQSTFTTLPIYLMWLALAAITAFVTLISAFRRRADGTKSI